MISFSRLTSLFSLVLLSTVAAHGQTAIIAKARAYLGSEEALDAVKSVHYVGKLVRIDPGAAEKRSEATIEVIFVKPDRHRITVTSEKGIEITGLDGYDGWQRVQDPKDRSKWAQAPAKVEEIKRLRASVWENVSFFRGIDTRGGRIEVLPPTTIDGIACNKVAFIYAPNIVFYRFFDQNTGKLVSTETESGNVSREQGEMIVAGVRFAKSMTTTFKMAGGKTSTTTVTFDQIKVNEKFPDSLFVSPSLTQN